MIGLGIESVRKERDIMSLETRINSVAQKDQKGFVNDHTFVQREYIRSYLLGEDALREVLAINNAYNPQIDHADRKYLKELYPYILSSATLDTVADRAWSMGSAILTFLLVEGVMIMVYFSLFQILSVAPGIGAVTVSEILPKIVKPRTKKGVTEK